MTESSLREREFRAVARDVGDLRADYGPWVATAAEAATLASEWCRDADPPYDEVLIERRKMGAPEMHIGIRLAS